MANKLPANLTFENALEELEEITHKLEEGKESLEKSMELYERGVLLKNFCETRLKEAEGKWMVLKKSPDGELLSEEIPREKKEDDSQGSMF